MVFADEIKSIGTIARSINSSIIQAENKSARQAELRGEIFAGDAIKTGGDAWLTINFYDLTRIVLRPNSILNISSFPETMDSGSIVLEVTRGGARVTTGTLAVLHPDRFIVITPEATLKSLRSEWVIRICEGVECEQFEKSIHQCADYQTIEKTRRQFIAVYKGTVNIDYCSSIGSLKAGETAWFDHTEKVCKVVDQIPCFVLFDGKLGRDKARTYASKLELIEAKEERDSERPSVRDVQRNVPNRIRIERPVRNRR